MDSGLSDFALAISKLRHSFKGREALKGVDFFVRRGSIHGFVGPNGAGKTTTLKIVATILPLQAGSVKVFGYDLSLSRMKIRSLMSFMPDYFAMYKHMTVFEYLDFFAAAYGLERSERDKTISDLLALTDMESRRNESVKGLSRGMQQRVSLARSLVHDPALLLLDEPASGLDPRARIELSEILHELRGMGKTVFISSHILSELSELCDSVTILDAGTVKYSGDMAGLLRGSEPSGSIAYRLRFKEPASAADAALKALAGVAELSSEDETREFKISFDPARLSPNALLSEAMRFGEIESFREDAKRLNQVFMDLTSAGVGD